MISVNLSKDYVLYTLSSLFPSIYLEKETCTSYLVYDANINTGKPKQRTLIVHNS